MSDNSQPASAGDCNDHGYDPPSGLDPSNLSVGGPVVSLGQLKDVLSPTAFSQLERLRDVDFCRVDYKFLETEFADALRELEHVESVTTALFRAVLEIKRTQALQSDRMVQLEDKIQSLQAGLKSLEQPTKKFHAQAEGQLRKERKELADFKSYVAERLESMQTSLGKTEQNVNVLRSRCTANKDTLDELLVELFPMKEFAKFLATEFSGMQERDEVIWGVIMRLQERIHDLALEVENEGSTRKIPYEAEVGQRGLFLEAEVDRRGLSLGAEMEQLGLSLDAEAEQQEPSLDAEADRRGLSLDAEAEQQGLSLGAEMEQLGMSLDAEAERQGPSLGAEAEQAGQSPRAEVQRNVAHECPSSPRLILRDDGWYFSRDASSSHSTSLLSSPSSHATATHPAEVPSSPTTPLSEVPPSPTAPLSEVPPSPTALLSEVPPSPTAPLSEVLPSPTAPLSEVPPSPTAPLSEVPSSPTAPLSEVLSFSTAPLSPPSSRGTVPHPAALRIASVFRAASVGTESDSGDIDAFPPPPEVSPSAHSALHNVPPLPPPVHQSAQVEHDQGIFASLRTLLPLQGISLFERHRSRLESPNFSSPPHSSRYPYLTMKGKVPCTCSKCHSSIYYEDDNEKRGRLVTAKTRQQHLQRDAWYRDGEARKTQDAISSTILLVTAGGPSSHSSGSRGSTLEKNRSAEDGDATVLAASSSRSMPDHSFMTDVMEVEAEVPVAEVNVPSASSTNDTRDHGPATSEATRRARLTLTNISKTAKHLRQTIRPDMDLTFHTRPTSIASPVPEPQEGTFITFCSWLEQQRPYVAHLELADDPELASLRMSVLQMLDAEISKLETMKRRAWGKLVVEVVVGAHLGDRSDGPLHVKSDILERRLHIRKMPAFILAALVMTAVLHSIAAASRLCSDYVVATLQVVIFGAIVWCNTQTGQLGMTPSQTALLNKVPDDIRSVLALLELEPDIVRYACCSKCTCIYPPDLNRPDDPYPHICTFQETDQPVCGTPLVHIQEHAPTRKDTAGKVTYEPNVIYPYRKLQTWFTDLISRRGSVERMRAAWSPFPGRWRDIFHAPAVRTFLGPDRKTPFSSQPDNSVHIVLSLFIDWFNPFGNKKAGKSHSIGAVYLICENLPDHLRYRPEYMCLLSIIPGPKEPTLHQINHLLRPLVDELLILWHRGILFENVSPDHVAVLVRAALIPLVCDLPALRKAAGFAGHMAAHFCSFCQLSKDQINDLHRSHWPTRSWREHLRHARKWREAPTEAARAAEFKEHGIRWSELLRLEYWDPTQFAVVDAMHNLLLGNLRHHCRDVWGLDVKDKASDSSKAQPHSQEQQQAQLLLVKKAVANKSKNTWGKIRKGYVVAVADFNGVSLSGTSLSKAAYATALMDHFASTPDSLKLPPVLDEATADFHLAENTHDISKHRILDQPTISQIRQDISNTIFLSWIERPPRNFGSPSHGKLKADQWRTVSTISLVITLCRLWGSSKASDRCKLLLDNFLALVCAVDLATRRSMDHDRANKFDDHMMHYLETLRSIFRHKLVPNHHLSLHLRQCLLLFGPVHAWWTFPFERYNGILQQLNTNNKTEQMPVTFIRYFHIGSTLRWLIDNIEWPTSLPFKKMVSSYRNAVKSIKAARIRIADFIPFGLVATDDDPLLQGYDEHKEKELPQQLYDPLFTLISSSSASRFSSAYAEIDGGAPILPSAVNDIGSTERDGVIFATRSAGFRNSFVLFNDPMSAVAPPFPLAGQISRVFLHGRREEGKEGKVILEMFLHINEYKSLDPAHIQHDPYRQFPDISTRLYYNEFHPTPRVVRVRDIQCHFATLTYTPEDIGTECIVVRSLDRE